jgi:hypothetical protein
MLSFGVIKGPKTALGVHMREGGKQLEPQRQQRENTCKALVVSAPPHPDCLPSRLVSDVALTQVGRKVVLNICGENQL